MAQIDLDQEGYRKVVLRSLVKVADQAETLGNRMVRETYNMKRADVDKAITVTPSSISKLQVDIRVKGRRQPLLMFQAKQLRKGVKITVKRGGRSLLPHAFIATMKSGHKGVFTREPKAKRLPIGEKFTISVAEMFGSKTIVDSIEALMLDKFPGILENQLQFYLSGGN